MSKLAIQGLIAITTALWLPSHADTIRPPWLPETPNESRHDPDDAAENASVLLPTGEDSR